MIFKRFKKDIPGGPMVKTMLPMQGNVGSVPGWRTRIPRAM